MTFATTLLKIWKLRIWVGIGGILAIAAAVASISLSHSVVYASASTQMLVDSPQSALANSSIDLTGYLARAVVYSRLMTSDDALQYIGRAAGIPGNEIAASGPVEVNGSAEANHEPVAIQAGRDVPVVSRYKLQFLQNPSLPVVDVYAEAPTTQQAIALANGAVTGFAAFMNHLYTGTGYPVASSKRIEIRALGGATGGIVDPAASKKVAAMIFVAVFLLWCGLVLFVSRLRADLRRVKAGDVLTTPEPGSPAIQHDVQYRQIPHEEIAVPARPHARDRHAPVRDRHAHFVRTHFGLSEPDFGAEDNSSSNHSRDISEADDRHEVGLRP